MHTLTEEQHYTHLLETELRMRAKGHSDSEIEAELEQICTEFESTYEEPLPPQNILNWVPYLRTRVFFVVAPVLVVFLSWPVGIAVLVAAGIAFMCPKGPEIQREVVDLDRW